MARRRLRIIGRLYDELSTGSTGYLFGYGLSYTSFDIVDAAVEKQEDNFVVSAKVKTTSSIDGGEVVQVYVDNSAANVVAH